MAIDIKWLRKDLEDDAYAGAFSGFPAMMIEAFDIEEMSDKEVIQKALDVGIDLSEYRV